MKALRTVVASALVAGALAVPGLAAAEGKGKPPKVETSKNVKQLDSIVYDGGTELARSGKYIYTGELDGGVERPSRGTKPEEGGLHIIDVSGKTPKEVGFLHCPGNDNDVEVVKPGLVTMSFHSNKCVPSAGTGLMTIDVSNPRQPKILGLVQTGAGHTHKPVPGTNLIYMAGGNLTGSGSRGAVIVDVSDPRKPKVAGEATNVMDCHDVSFYMSKDKKLGVCAGAVGSGETQIWDMSDPMKPTVLGYIFNPAIQYSHYGVISSDGEILAIDDEAFAAHECHTGQSPTGRVWIYDISDPRVPLPQGSMAAPRGDGDGTIGNYVGWAPSWCLSHGLDWQPGTRNLGVTWFTGGWSVLNVSNPTSPTEVAWGMSENASTYSILWAEKGDTLYTNDFANGFDAFSISGLPKK
ncbi:MAG: LVIVD repeat-containing protein [Actinomycetota bacterium]